MVKRKAAGGTPATVALERAGVPFTVHTYEHDPAATSYGLEAAEALGLDPATVLKTLLADVDGRLVVGIVPVTGQLDLKALAAAVGGKRAAMADPAVAERTTGYVVGGISPIGQKKRLTTVLDATALRSCRRSTSAGASAGSTSDSTRATWSVCSTHGSRRSVGTEPYFRDSRTRPCETSSSVQTLTPKPRSASRLSATSSASLSPSSRTRSRIALPQSPSKST